MNTKRVSVLSLFLLLGFGALLYRLASIQLISTESFGPDNVNLLEESVDQRTSEINLSSGRGIFLDNKEKPLNQAMRKDIVLFPFLDQLSNNAVLDELPVSTQQLQNKIKQLKKPSYLTDLFPITVTDSLYEKIKKEQVPGIVAVERTVVQDPTDAQHLLGIVRNNKEEYYNRYPEYEDNKDAKPIGISGLQATFDPFLQSQNEQKILYHVDAQGTPMMGLNLRYIGESDTFYPTKVQTTLDMEKQKLSEKIIDKYDMKMGGLVLLDVESRDVLAMVSRPTIDMEQPYKGNTIQNQMLTAHFPGSIFKTVTAAAALESDNVDVSRSFNCNQNLYGDGPSDRQLGSLTFTESYAQSCNRTFAILANELVKQDPTILETYADKLGLLEPVGWNGTVFHFSNFKQFPDEEPGKVWGNEQDPNVERAIAQTAIGQKEVRVTPLAIANMMATVADGGNKKEVRAVQKILYRNGTSMFDFSMHRNRKNELKPETAKLLQGLMEQVVENGTGQTFKGLQVAGKSGTAQTGMENKFHHWFAGYFPKDNPKYAMVVVDLYQSDEASTTYNIYRDIVSNLLRGDSS
ncbi:penicillin-binding transpeptidase domain-containing protein [Radiobacillus deserti]|uniref:serine-type D-Ala-D-Ala carboxypeptidase n=1 Tax=Radiobacillus deserti TaxID=2594883 RepID=A0A516KH07_9BACI|nr:penicillin-binding transpeptidase domain-containing protein [Radiobacillus deserti]QDP40688.1 penicillin-binding protein 2 [Radiobacillus deserti]